MLLSVPGGWGCLRLCPICSRAGGVINKKLKEDFRGTTGGPCVSK